MAITDSNEERIVSTGETNADTEIEYTLRPKILSEYIGQTKAKENLKVFIEAAKMRGEPLDHVLLYGPPGLVYQCRVCLKCQLLSLLRCLF